MKIATWNVNSLSVRLPQVLAWLATNPVDALCLQELKLTDDKFPHVALQDAGYHAVAFGQKTYNGVAILTRTPVRDVVRNIPGFDDEQSRVIAATLDTRVWCWWVTSTWRPKTATLTTQRACAKPFTTLRKSATITRRCWRWG